jgi:hypothetical protein
VNSVVFAGSSILTSSDDKTLKVYPPPPKKKKKKNSVALMTTDSTNNSTDLGCTQPEVSREHHSMQIRDQSVCIHPCSYTFVISSPPSFSVSPKSNIVALPLDNRRTKLYDLNGVKVGKLHSQGTEVCVCARSRARAQLLCSEDRSSR